MLDRPRDEALDAFLTWLSDDDDALRDEVVSAKAHHSREEWPPGG